MHFLTFKFNYVMCAIKGSKNLNVMMRGQLKGSLQPHEEKIKRTQEELIEQLS